jgi:hypothetical protein
VMDSIEFMLWFHFHTVVRVLSRRLGLPCVVPGLSEAIPV